MFLPESFGGKDISLVTLKHLMKSASVYIFLKLQNTCRSMGYKRSVVLGGRNLAFTRSHSASIWSTKAGQCTGALSTKGRHLSGSSSSERYFFKVSGNTLCSRSMNGCRVTQVFRLALHITRSLALCTF